MKLRKLLTSSLVLLAALASPSGPTHAVTSLLGGTTLGPSDHLAVRGEIGWPGLGVAWILPVNDRLDISPRLGITFGEHLRAGYYGLEPGAEIRWNLVESGGFSVALLAEPAILVGFGNVKRDGYAGIRIGAPAVAVGYRLGSKIHLVGALRAPLRITFGDDGYVRWPLLADIGVEVLTSRSDDVTVNLNGMLTLGGDFCVSGCSGSDLVAGVGLGASVLW